MLTELLNSVNSDIARGMAQAAGAIVLCLAVVGLCRQFAVHVERETAISIARGLVQMVFVGIVLAALLHGSLLVGAMILLAMTSRTRSGCPVPRSSSQAASKASPMMRVAASSKTTLVTNGRIDPTAPLPIHHTMGAAAGSIP